MKTPKTLTQRQRKAIVAKSLFAVGESASAKDFIQCDRDFQSIEETLRAKLKAVGPDMGARWTKAIANAIVEAQCLPHAQD